MYDYSLVEYKNAKTKVIIICKIHGEFPTLPSCHSSPKVKRGCPKCAIKRNSDKQRFTKEQFIEKAKITHGDTYNYSLVEYKNTDTEVIIICHIHGEFKQSPNNHYKKGCKYCGIESARNSKIKYNIKTFINESNKIHGTIYDYSKVEYKDLSTKVIIICKKHGEFIQLPCGHLYGYGCQKCGRDIIRFTKEQFIKKATEIHKDKYDYSKVEYENQTIAVIIICKTHGEFYIRPKNHIHGQSGCPDCSNKKSEKLCREILKEYTGLNFPTIRPNFLKNNVSGCNLELDGYCEDLKLAFEYQGKQHYEYIPYFHRKEGDFEKQQERDKLKLELCKKYYIDVILIPYTLDYQNEYELRKFIREELQKLLGECDFLI